MADNDQQTVHDGGSAAISFGPDRPLKLLLVEDSPFDARLVQESLLDSQLGPHVQVRHVGSLAAAAAALSDDDYDCVMLDLGLPDGQGPEGVARLCEVADDVTIVVMTGHDSDEIGLQAINYGAQEYLVKGQVEGDALVRILRHAVERNRLLRELQTLREREYFLATHDPLTGLPNRQLFRDRALTALAQAERQGNRVALCYIDLDGFKPINDIFGHASGDAALSEVAGVLQAMVRGSDTVARIGGDEFVILVSPADSVEQVTSIAARIADRIRAIRNVAGHEVHIGASVGVALFPDHANDLDELLMHADAAMLRTKTVEPGSYLLYEPQMGSERDRDIRLAAELARALSEDRVVPYYQPWWDVLEDRQAGLEVLARWQGASGEMVYPDEYVAAAKHSGQLLDLGRRLLAFAERDYAQWRAAELGIPVLEINLSGRELREQSYIENLCRQVGRMGFADTTLQFQADGASLLHSRDLVLSRRMAFIRDQGFRVSLGRVDVQTPLSLLAQWPLDSIRLSARQMQDEQGGLGEGDRDRLLRLLEFADRQEADLIVSGVENQAQWEALKALGCRYLQGFWKLRPADAQTIAALLAQR